MECQKRIEAYLRDNQVPFQAQHHSVAYTAQQVAASEHIPGRLVAKVVIVLADGRMIMVALPAPSRLDLIKLGGVLGARDVRLAQEREFADTFPDCEVGAMPPFGNRYGIPVYVDRALTEVDTMTFQAGTHTDTISLKYADFERLVNPAIADLALHT